MASSHVLRLGGGLAAIFTGLLLLSGHLLDFFSILLLLVKKIS